MANVFEKGFNSLPAVGLGIVGVTPADDTDLTNASIIYVETAGDLEIVDAKGTTSVVAVPDNFILPVVVVRVKDANTTATGIWAIEVN